MVRHSHTRPRRSVSAGVIQSPTCAEIERASSTAPFGPVSISVARFTRSRMGSIAPAPAMEHTAWPSATYKVPPLTVTATVLMIAEPPPTRACRRSP